MPPWGRLTNWALNNGLDRVGQAYRAGKLDDLDRGKGGADFGVRP